MSSGDLSHPSAEVRLPQNFPVKPYRPDGGFSLGGALQLIGFLGLAGIILGAIASFVSRYFYLLLIFPLAIGFGVGYVGNLCIKRFKIRRPLTCGVAGFVAGGLAMLSMHYFNYRHFESSVVAEVGQEQFDTMRAIARNADALRANPEAIPEEERADILEFLGELDKNEDFRRALLVDSVFSFIDYRAYQGVEISSGRGGKRDKGINLGYVGSYIYWVAEALVVAGLAFFTMKGEAAQPFCGACELWKVGEPWGPLSHAGEIKTALEEGRVEQFGFDPTSSTHHAVVTAFRCPECGDAGEIDIRIEGMTTNAKGEVQRTQLLQATYPGEAYPALELACARPAVIAPPHAAAEAAPPEGESA